MPRSRIFGIYLLIVVVALGAGMLIAQFFGSATPLLSGYVVPASANDPTAIVVEPTSAPTVESATAALEPTALPENAPTAAQPSEPPTPTAEAPAAAPSPAATTTSAEYTEYTVQKGDTLKSIAEKYSLTVRDLLAINQFENPDSLNIGVIVRIPKTQ